MEQKTTELVYTRTVYGTDVSSETNFGNRNPENPVKGSVEYVSQCHKYVREKTGTKGRKR